MKILKESFIEETPKVYVSQTQLGTSCVFEFMSIAAGACQLLSQLDYPLSDIEPVSRIGDHTHYEVLVIGNTDRNKVVNLLSSYKFLVIME